MALVNKADAFKNVSSSGSATSVNEMILQDKETLYTCDPAEDNFERYRNDLMLKDRVTYWNIVMLPYTHEWGHANVNLLEPVHRPGSSSMIADVEGY